MRPPRFSLRFLLLAVTISAVGLGAWRVINGPQPISDMDAATVDWDFSKWQVERCLGSPHYVRKDSWVYALEGRIQFLNVIFRDGRVVKVERQSWLPGNWTTETLTSAADYGYESD